MKTNLKLVTTSLLVILILLAVEGTGTNPKLAKSVELGGWIVGEWWKYNVDYKGEIGMLGTMTMTVSSDLTRFSQSGRTYECYEVEATGSGTVYGQGISGTWSMNGESLYQKSDFSFVRTTMTTDATASSNISSMTMRQIVETTYNPPLEANKGPFEVGENWAAATTETTTTQTTINQVPDTKTDTKSYTRTYSVLRSQMTTVPAGRFSTLVIRETDPEGSYRDCYYSQEAGGDVKEEAYDAENQLQVTVELVRYNYTPNKGSSSLSPSTTAAAIVVVLVIVIAIIVAYNLGKKKPPSSQESSAPSSPPAPPIPPEASTSS